VSVGPAVATRELLAPRDDVWTFISAAGRLPDWWPGIRGVQDDGDTWTIEGDERPGLGSFAGGAASEYEGRHETVRVEKEPPSRLRLSFADTGYRLEVVLEATAANRTAATVSIADDNAHEGFLERAQEFVFSGGGPTHALAESLLEHLYELCQTGDDA
jgi:uncharacterized protein YndB with AHSA1/START domain